MFLLDLLVKCNSFEVGYTLAPRLYLHTIVFNYVISLLHVYNNYVFCISSIKCPGFLAYFNPCACLREV